MQMRNMSKNWRWTRQRRSVLEALREMEDHPTAESVYRMLRDRGEAISLATVYRTLRALADDREARALYGAGADRFDGRTGPHYHFVCTTCGRIIDLAIPYMDELDRSKLSADVEVHGHELTFRGRCGACSGSEEGSSDA